MPNVIEKSAERKHHMRVETVMPSKRVKSNPHMTPRDIVPNRENAFPPHSLQMNMYRNVKNGPMRKNSAGNHPPSSHATCPVQIKHAAYRMNKKREIDEYLRDTKEMGRDVCPISFNLVLKIDISNDLFGENLLMATRVRHSNLIQSTIPILIPKCLCGCNDINATGVIRHGGILS